MIKMGGIRHLVESDVGDDLAADVGVEAADDVLALHGELHA